jgi:predicted nucleic acid-binding Zn ribbon protein
MGSGQRDSRRAERIVEVRESVHQLARMIGAERPDVVAVVFSRWGDLVGSALAGHAVPERLNDDSLVVRVDSPAWASHLRSHASEVVLRLREACGDNAPKRLVIRVGNIRKDGSDQGF